MIIQFRFPEYSFFYGLLAIVWSLAIVPLFIGIAQKSGLLDIPGKFAHKVHDRPVPLAGGTALMFSIGPLSLILGLWKHEFIRVLLSAVTFIYIFGLVDDVCGLSVIFKLTGQIAASLFLISSGVHVYFVSSIQVPFLSNQIAALFDIAITLFWLVGVTNSMNLIDSKDGIASGISSIVFLFFVLITTLSGQVDLTEISILLLGITIGIYFYNVTPARLFLGDSGSQTLGFLVAAIAMEYAPVGLSPISSWFVPILLVAMPIFDTTLVVYSRFRQGLPIYRANLDHTYHRLVAAGFDERRAVLTIHLAAIQLSLVALVTFCLPPVIANIVFGMILVVGMVIVIYSDRHWRVPG